MCRRNTCLRNRGWGPRHRRNFSALCWRRRGWGSSDPARSRWTLRSRSNPGGFACCNHHRLSGGSAQWVCHMPRRLISVRPSPSLPAVELCTTPQGRWSRDSAIAAPELPNPVAVTGDPPWAVRERHLWARSMSQVVGNCNCEEYLGAAIGQSDAQAGSPYGSPWPRAVLVGGRVWSKANGSH